jgi:hypothetical protein
LLAIDITIAGIAFAATDDEGYPGYPQVTIDASGQISSIDFLTPDQCCPAKIA